MGRRVCHGLLLAVLWGLAGTPASAAGDEALAERYREWLTEVKLLITPEERDAFLALTDDHRRDAFIEAFWRARDPDPATPLNDFRDRFYARREEAKARFGSVDAEAARIWIVNGPPADEYRTDCGIALWPIEIWYYGRTDAIRHPFTLLFYRPGGGAVLKLWDVTQGYKVLQTFRGSADDVEPGRPDLPTPSRTLQSFARYIDRRCGSEQAQRIYAALQEAKGKGRGTQEEAQTAPAPDPEWLATFAAGSTDLEEQARAADPISEEHLRWLDEVSLLISKPERRAFLALKYAHQREGFIEEFWRIRDSDPRTEINEFRKRFEARREIAIERYGSAERDQARVTILNGEPADVYRTDCMDHFWPLEIWTYHYSEISRRAFQLIFYQPPPGVGPFRLWHAMEGYRVFVRAPLPFDPTGARAGTGAFERFYLLLADPRDPQSWCPSDAGRIIQAMRGLEYDNLMLSEVIDQAPTVDPEWLQSYRTYSTELAGDAPPLEAELRFDFPTRRQSRTVVRGTLLVPPDPAAAAEARAFTLTGEVLRGTALHESFRYVFQLLPAADPSAATPLVFERALRPGDFRLVLKLEENRSGRALRLEREITVPLLEDGAAAQPADAPAPGPPPAPLRLLAPANDLVSGVVRLEAEVADPRVASVVFSLDGKTLLARNRPPWTIELRVGELPRSVRVRAVARDARGETLGGDELLLNAAPHRFAVRLVEPRDGVAAAPMRVRAEVRAPADRVVDRLELFLDETPIGTLYQEPWELLVPSLPEPAPLYLRAIAHLADGTTAEDAVLLAGSGAERGAVEVDLVEVYTAAVDASGRPVHGLGEADFAVREDGRPQRLQRFQHVTELPLHVALLVDTSASMAEMLPEVETAAIEFFRSTLEPGDRAAVLTFSEEPRIAAPFDDDIARLTTALVGLRAERGTALWDSLVFSLHYFQGVPGRRALLVFSDGADRGSRFTFDEALAYAQHAGVAIYAISFGNPASGVLEGRRRLARLAEATGGQAFTLTSTDELDATYDGVEEDLRSQYLLVYQSDGEGPEFRAVEVTVKRPGVTARAMRGYIP